ncbi:MAG TPA: hypothetical protein ENN07_04615 [candidate division Zixibacteria bacterium]|nr:hypothetical protein [candidate division Zixibacteria bacterium]
MKKLIMMLIAITAIALMITASCDCGTDPKPDPVVPTVAVLSSGSSMVVGEVVEAQVQMKGISEVAGFGLKLVYDPFKLEIVSMTRDDNWLTSNDGSVQQMALNTFNEDGYAKVVLAVFPTSASVGSTDDTYKPILDLRVRAKSAGNATLSVSIDNTADSDLGIFNASADLVTGIATENHTWSVSSSY